MSKKMLINATHPEEHRVAIVEDGVLSELDIEITGKEQTKGNIYKAVVVRIETGLQAAFVDYGGERPGFLQIGEIHPSFHKPDSESENKGRPRINDLLRRGQELLVQVVKEERGTKGAALTTYLSLPGRYMVLMPESDTKGISRKIEQESTRKKLKQAMNSMELPDNIGYIVRTAGIGQKKTELKRDVDYLVRVYEKILELGKKVKAPALVYKESNLVIRSIRDYFSPDIDEVLVDDPRAAQEGKEFFQEVMPEYAQLVKQHQERRPIFARYQIEEQIEGLTRNKVALPSGGSIVIDTTEALVAIDVNSGKMATEKGVEATAFKSNMEAAAETARQLRLRDLGGLIVIDFIDMRDRKHIREVEKCLKEALKTDKARVSVGRISQFGLLEMSRQRIKASLAAASYLPCPHCEGSGRIKSAEAQALSFLRRLSAGMAKGQVGRVEAQVPLEVAAYLLNNKRAALLKLERQYNAVIYIKGCPDLANGQLEVEFIKREKEEQKSAQHYVDASSVRAEAPSEQGAEKGASEETAKTEGEKEAPSNGRKRRRPRRRRKSSGEQGDKAAAAPAQSGEETAQPPAAQPVAEEQPDKASDAAAVKAEEAAAPAASSDAAPPKPAEPTATAGEPPQTVAATTPAAAETPQPAPAANEPTKVEPEAAAPAAEKEPAAASDKEAEKPKPRRRKPAAAKKPAKPKESQPEAAVKETAEAAEADTAKAETAAAAQEEAAKPKTPRRRKAAPKKAAAESAEQPTTEKAAPAPAAETKEAAETSEEKPKRRRTRKPVAKKPAAEAAKEKTQTAEAATPSDSAAAPASDAAAEEPKKKPARRGRPRKTADKKTTSDKAGEKTSADTAPTDAKAVSGTDNESAKEEAPKKPARRGRPRKKPAAEEQQESKPE